MAKKKSIMKNDEFVGRNKPPKSPRPSKKKKSPTKLGDERMDRFVALRESQGYLSFKKNRVPFGTCDIWNEFDIFSMNAEVLELAQVKGKDSRASYRQAILDWMTENADKLPANLRCIVALEDDALGTFRTQEVKLDV